MSNAERGPDNSARLPQAPTRQVRLTEVTCRYADVPIDITDEHTIYDQYLSDCKEEVQGAYYDEAGSTPNSWHALGAPEIKGFFDSSKEEESNEAHLILDASGVQVWSDNRGRLHHPHQAAVIQDDGDADWARSEHYHHGNLHRDDGPAKYYHYEEEPCETSWYIDGVQLSSEEKAKEIALYCLIAKTWKDHFQCRDEGYQWDKGYRTMALELAEGNQEKAEGIIRSARAISHAPQEPVPTPLPTNHHER